MSPTSCCPACVSAWPRRNDRPGAATNPGKTTVKLGITRAAGRLCARFPLALHEFTVMPNTRTNAPRGGLVFDMRQLGRQAGSDLAQTRIVPAPEDLRLELVGVPVGADVELKLRFEAVSEGVLVTGTATAPIAGECARCLAPLTSTVTASFMELYLYQDGRPRREADGRHHDGRHLDARHLDGRHQDGRHQDGRHQDGRHQPDEEPGEGEDEERYLNGDLLDLEPTFRDAVVLALPMSPRCRPDCPGLCVECGIPLAEAGPDHRHRDAPDPRWAGLSKLDQKSLNTNTTQEG